MNIIPTAVLARLPAYLPTSLRVFLLSALCLCASVVKVSAADIHQHHSTAVLTGNPALADRYLVPNSKNTRLFNLNVYSSAANNFIQVYDSSVAATPGAVTVTASAATDTLTLGSAQTTWTTGTPISFTSTTTLPAPLASNTLYYVIYLSSTTVRLATDLNTALVGSRYLDLTSAGTGTVTGHVLDGGPCIIPSKIASADGTTSYAYNQGCIFTNGIYAIGSLSNITYSATTSSCYFDSNYSQN